MVVDARCINASNPYHECSAYCANKIQQALDKAAAAKAAAPPPKPKLTGPAPTAKPQLLSFGETVLAEEHERLLAKGAAAKLRVLKEIAAAEPAAPAAPLLDNAPESSSREDASASAQQQSNVNVDEHAGEPNESGGAEPEEEEAVEPGHDPMANMTPKERRLFELRLRLNECRKANHSAAVAEKRKTEQPEVQRDISKKRWWEEKQKHIAETLAGSGIDPSKRYLLHTEEQAEEQYKKRQKKPAAFGWDVFNQRSLYNAYKKRTQNVPYTPEDYEKIKASQPEFYRDADSMQYGRDVPVPEENVDRMVAELEKRHEGRKEFSRRRRYHEERDIDSINDRNEHFNRKIERAFGKYTTEIKANLERGTALPD
eukprot:jgi/Chlat1/2988/Chrsp2S04706